MRIEIKSPYTQEMADALSQLQNRLDSVKGNNIKTEWHQGHAGTFILTINGVGRIRGILLKKALAKELRELDKDIEVKEIS